MVSKQDLYDAKEMLSARLLRKGFKAGVLGFRATNVIGTLVDRAGQNVHALGIGYKTVEGRITKKLCVQIFVTDKLPKSLLRLRQLIPPEFDGIPTDVIASPPAFLLAGTKKSATRRAAKSGRAATTHAADDSASLQGQAGRRRRPRFRGASSHPRNQRRSPSCDRRYDRLLLSIARWNRSECVRFEQQPCVCQRQFRRRRRRPISAG